MALDTARNARDLRTQTDLAAAQLTPETLDRRVPTCPDWILRDLARHLGEQSRRTALVVAESRTARPSPEEVLSAPPPEDAAELAAWVREGAAKLAETLERADPEAPVWSWAGERPVAFWGRRVASETAVHAVDAQLVSGPAAPLDPARAADIIEEWLSFQSLPRFADARAASPVRTGGETLHLHATDIEGGEWTIHRTEEGITVEPGHAKGDVALRGPVSGLALVLLRRLSPQTADVEVLGDRTLLDDWLEHSRF